MSDKWKSFFKSLGYILIHYGAQFVATIVIGAIITVNLALKASGPSDMAQQLEMQLEVTNILMKEMNWVLLFASIIALLTYFIMFKVKKRDLKEEINLNSTKKANLLISVGLGIALLFINIFVITLIESTGYFDNAFGEFAEIAESLMGGSILLNILVVGIVVPIAEEVLFRGLVFKTLRKGFTLKWAIIIQGILFGVFHMNLVQGFYAAFLGIVFGYVVYKTKSLWTGIVLHITNNTVSTLLSSIEGDFMSVPVMIVFVVAAVGGVILSIKAIKKINPKEEELLIEENIV